MALNQLLVPIDFTGGLDNKADEKLVLPSKFTTLENAVFDGSNTISKGGGYSAVALTAMDSGATAVAGTARSLATRGDELLIEANGKLHAVLDATAGGQVPRTTNFVRTSVAIGDVISSERDQTEVDGAYGSGTFRLSCWAWVENGTSLYCTVVNESTGAVIVQRRLSTSANRPRVVWDSGASKFFIYYITTGGNLVCDAITGSTPGAATVTTTIYTDAQGGANSKLDAVYCAADTATYLAYRLAAGGFKIVRLTTGTTAAANRSVAAYTPSAIAVECFTGTAVVAVGLVNSAGTAVDAYTFPFSLAAEASGSIMAAGAAYRVTIFPEVSGGGGLMRVFWEEGGVTAGPTRLIRRATINDSASVTSAAEDVRRSVAIASKPFLFNSEIYIGATLMSTVQPTVFALNTEGSLSTNTQKGVVARFLVGTAGHYRGTWDGHAHVPAVLSAVKEASSFTLPVLRRGELRTVNGSDVTPSGLARADLYFTQASRPLQNQELENLAVFGGGCPMVYDGQNVSELGHHSYPDPIDFAAVGVAGGALTAGTYGVALVWETTDATGRRTQSAPAIAESVVLAANDKLQVTCPTDRLTRHDSLQGMTRLVVYRTEENGSIYYRDTPASGSDINDYTVDSIVLTFNTASATLISNEVLYTTGSILENQPFPAYRVSCMHQGRFFMGGLEDPYRVRYTEELRPGYAPATHEVYELTVPSSGGPVTGLASLDDKLVVFCTRRTWFFFGQGPNRLGLQDAYSLAQIAVEDLGCRVDGARTVCATPDGVWFRSDQGFRFLTRGMSLARYPDGKFLGAEVDSSVDGCVSAIRFPAKQQVWFYTGSIVLVFDYQWGQWSKLTNHTCIDAAVWRSTHAHVSSGATLFAAGGTTHNGTAINIKAESAWIKLAGVQGFQRAYEASVLGQTIAATTFKIEVGYNYESTYTTPATLAVTAGVLQVRHQFAVQKCEAIRFRISENNALGNAGFSLTNLSILLGVKRGGMKLASGKTV